MKRRKRSREEKKQENQRRETPRTASSPHRASKTVKEASGLPHKRQHTKLKTIRFVFRTKKMHIIPEEGGEDEEEDEDEEGTTGSSDSRENSDEDIENLLAPQEQSQKKE